MRARTYTLTLTSRFVVLKFLLHHHCCYYSTSTFLLLCVYLGEAKNLTCRTNSCGTVGIRDVYCTIALDQEEICRTPKVSGSLKNDYLFCDEFQFEIARKFRFLTVYLWDRDKHLKQDKAIGKIAIKREELHMYNHKDHWFSLMKVDEDSEVQGKAQVEIAIDDGSKRCEDLFGCGGGSSRQQESKENASTNNHHRLIDARHETNSSSKKKPGDCLLSSFRNENKPRLAIKLVQCAELARKNGSCDPYAVVTAHYTNKRKIVKRTKVKKKTVNPHFDETLYFDLNVDCNDSKHDSNSAYTVAPLVGADLYEVNISFWHSNSPQTNIFGKWFFVVFWVKNWFKAVECVIVFFSEIKAKVYLQILLLMLTLSLSDDTHFLLSPKLKFPFVKVLGLIQVF